MKVLIADPISKHGLSILSDSGLDLIIKADSPVDEKLSAVKDVDGIIIRSGTKVDNRKSANLESTVKATYQRFSPNTG